MRGTKKGNRARLCCLLCALCLGLTGCAGRTARQDTGSVPTLPPASTAYAAPDGDRMSGEEGLWTLYLPAKNGLNLVAQHVAAEPGILRAEKLETLTRELLSFQSNAQVDALGAVDRAVVSVYDVPTRTFYRKEFNEAMELSNLCGTVTRKDGAPYLHLHATLCDTDLNAHGGHANELHVSATCEMVVRLIPGQVGRQPDEGIGLNLFSFQ